MTAKIIFSQIKTQGATIAEESLRKAFLNWTRLNVGFSATDLSTHLARSNPLIRTDWQEPPCTSHALILIRRLKSADWIRLDGNSYFLTLRGRTMRHEMNQ